MNKGFTLIEIIAVIVILSIIGLISVPIVNSTIKKSKTKMYNEQVDYIIEAAKNYTIEHDDILPEEDNKSINVKVSTLINYNYLTTEITNPITNEPMTGCVTILYKNFIYQYTYVESCS